MSLPRFTFEKKLSLDGVAIIIGSITALLWIGSLRQQINDLQMQGQVHSQQLSDLNTAVSGVRLDVSVLQAVVVERTGKPIK